jgi:hypothetical protein
MGFGETYVFQVPGGPAHKHLQPGDILVRSNKKASATLLIYFFYFCIHLNVELAIVQINF